MKKLLKEREEYLKIINNTDIPMNIEEKIIYKEVLEKLKKIDALIKKEKDL